MLLVDDSKLLVPGGMTDHTGNYRS